MLIIYRLLALIFFPAIFIYLMVRTVRRKGYLRGFSERLGNLERVIDNGFVRSPPARQVFGDTSANPLCFWLHAVSAGEVMAAIPLVKGLRSRYPSCRVVFSTTTPAGRAILATNGVDADAFFYVPLDISWIVDRVVTRIAPTLFLLIETDIWPALLHSLARREIPSLLLNGRISLRRVRFRYLFRPLFRMLKYVSVQTEVDAERLIRLGVDSTRIAITGNMKFAQALSQLKMSTSLNQMPRLPQGAVGLIAGSTHAGEDEKILECYETLRTRGLDVFLILVPRHIERVKTIERLVRAGGLAPVRWSRFEGWSNHEVVLVDSVGILPRLYGFADFVFVGGSFVKRGGHNVLEPAAWGKPIFYGPYMENFSSIAESLEREGAAIRVKDGQELARHLETLIRDPFRAAKMGRRARAFVDKNQGSVEENLAIIDKALDRDSLRAEFKPYFTRSSRCALELLMLMQAAWLFQSLQSAW